MEKPIVQKYEQALKSYEHYKAKQIQTLVSGFDARKRAYENPGEFTNKMASEKVKPQQQSDFFNHLRTSRKMTETNDKLSELQKELNPTNIQENKRETPVDRQEFSDDLERIQPVLDQYTQLQKFIKDFYEDYAEGWLAYLDLIEDAANTLQ